MTLEPRLHRFVHFVQDRRKTMDTNVDNDRKSLPLWRRKLHRHLPITKWLPTYKKEDLVADFIAGLTLGLTMVPQSIAYAALAGLTSQYGLYATIMGGFVYCMMGTIKEVSMGPTSLMAFLTYEFSKELPFEFICLLTFMAGCMELLMGVFQFGFLVDFISAPVTSGFQSATSVIIISSQIKDILGLQKVKTGKFFQNIIRVAKKVPDTKLPDLALGVSCCVVLLLLRKLKDVSVGKMTEKKLRLKKTLWFISISRNAIVVLICCVIAYYFEENGGSPFRLSGKIPYGLPPFQLPKFSTEFGNVTYSFTDMCYEIGSGIFMVPLVAVLANVTIAKAFSTGGTVDATQEMISLGMCNIAGSMVSSLPTCGAFTRSAISNSSGVRTPMAGLFSGSLIIIFLAFLSPYLYYIPKATLAAVLICAVLFMIDWKTCLLLWNSNSKRDFLCFLGTSLACLTLGIEVGLLVGVAINVAQLLHLWARPSISIEIRSSKEGDYYYIKPDIGLFFPAVDFLRNELSKNCQQKLHLVIDCLNFKGVDYTTAQGIYEMVKEYQRKGRKLLFINLLPRISSQFNEANIDLDIRHCANSEDEINGILFSSSNIPLTPSAILLDEMVPKEKYNDVPTNENEQRALL